MPYLNTKIDPYPTDNRIASERVGRDGQLSLVFSRQGNRTHLSDAFFRTPLQVFPGPEVDDGGCAHTYLLNPTGGLVGGDYLSIHARLAETAHALITTPSATRIYRSPRETAVQEIKIQVGPHAILEWLPDTMIPFAGSRFQQKLQVHLSEGSTLLLWDAFSSGRVARGERWAFAKFANEICITLPDKKRVMERYALDPAVMNLTAPGIGEGWDYFAAFYMISARPLAWNTLLDSLKTTFSHQPGRVLGSVSCLPLPGLVVRLVAKTAIDLAVIHSRLWDAARQFILGLKASCLRKL
jgi:urease accessory protein